MAKVRYTKAALREQQRWLDQLNRYLPTLQLKKALLQAEVERAREEIEVAASRLNEKREAAELFSELLTAKTAVDPRHLAHISKVKKSYENIAGVEIPKLEGVVFEDVSYGLFDTPPWVDGVIAKLRAMVVNREEWLLAKEKEGALKGELKAVSIRVNLFEKILIPRTEHLINRIKVFLGDQELAAISRAKVAKTKIEEHREAVRAYAY